MIQIQNLTHRYGDRVALSNVSFEVKKGEIFGLLGPNGGGKSTLFRILSTMMVPTEGRALDRGLRRGEATPREVRQHVGVVFQTQSLDKALTVEENLRAQGHLHGLKRRGSCADRMERAMERLGLADRRRDLVETLSGGSAAARGDRQGAAAPAAGAADGRGLHGAGSCCAPRPFEARGESAGQRRRDDPADHSHPGGSGPVRPADSAAPGEDCGAGESRRSCGRASAATWWCWRAGTRRRWRSGSRSDSDWIRR